MNMTAVTVHANGPGDGWLSVDTGEWMRDRMTESDPHTESLRDWLRYRDGDVTGYYSGHTYPHTEHIIRWARVAFRGDPPSGLYGEGEPWEMNTYNGGDNLLSDDIGAVWFYADDRLWFVETTDAYGRYCDPTVYAVSVSDECLIDYHRAQGECRNGHQWETEDGSIRMRPSGGAFNGDDIRIGDSVRMAFGKPYVPCPECNRAVRWGMFTW